MSQQINLYQPIFRKQQKVFSTLAILQIAGLVVVGFGAIYGVGQYHLARLNAQIADLERQRDAASARLTQFTGQQQQQPARRSALLEDQLRQAQRELDHKLPLVEAMEQRHRGNTTGFSRHFAGLGRQRVNGVWLTRIVVTDGGQVDLDGHAEQAQLVPQYLQRLSREQAFRGTEFHSLRIERSDEPAGAAFRVSTTAQRGEWR